MNTPERQQGFSLIELLIVVAIIGIVAAIAIPNFLASRRAANEASAIATLRQITSAEAAYCSTTGGGNFGDSAQLGAAEFIDPILAAAPATKSGYVFVAAVTVAGQFEATAAAVSASTGNRSFYTNELGVIYETPGLVPGTRAAPGTAIK